MSGPRAQIGGALLRGITRNVLLLGLVSFLTDVSSEMLTYLIPLFLANVLAASPGIIGVIEGLAESAATLFRLLSGWLSDRFERRTVLVGFGYGASVVGKALYLVATSWPVVLAARLGDRFGKGIRTAPRDALIADSTPQDVRGRAFGFHRALDTAGAVVGVATAALIVQLLQGDVVKLAADTFRTLVLIALVPGAAAVLVIFMFVRDVPRQKGADEPARAGTAAPSGSARPARIHPSLLRRFPAAFWFFVAASGLFALGNSSDAFLSLRSQNLGLAVRDLLFVVLAFNITNAVVSLPAGVLSDRYGRRGPIALAWGIYAVTYLGFALAGSVAAVPVLWIIYGAYYGISDAVGRALVADLAPVELRATGYGILNAVVGALLLPASIIAGQLWDRIGPAAPFWFGAACAAGGTLLLVALVRPTARNSVTA
jgi:MFS family permease